MRFFLFLTFFTISNYSFSQEEETTSSKTKMIGISLSPDYSYRILSSSGSSVGNFISDYRNENEQPIVGYTTGLNFVSNVSERFGVGTGIHFSKKGYKSGNGHSGLTFGDMIDSRRGFVYQVGTISYEYNHYYIGIPLKAILTFGKGKIKFIATAGFTTNIMLKSTTTIVIDYANANPEKFTYS